MTGLQNLTTVLKRLVPASWKWWLKRRAFRIKRRENFGRASTSLRKREDWVSDLPSEVDFWETFVESAEFRLRLNPEKPFCPEKSQRIISDLLARAPVVNQPRVLDVGAGPITTLGTVWSGGRVDLHAVDPLANTYEEILSRKGIVPPVRTRQGEAEKLLDLYPEGSFDLVYSSNALDHSYDPVTAIRNMVLLCKPSGFAFLRHFENEAEKEDFFGLHKWNFFEKSGDMIIANRAVEISLAKELSGLASVSCTSLLDRNGIVHAVIQRTKDAK
jgi:SAM-dependent methyltransferase